MAGSVLREARRSIMFLNETLVASRRQGIPRTTRSRLSQVGPEGGWVCVAFSIAGPATMNDEGLTDVRARGPGTAALDALADWLLCAVHRAAWMPPCLPKVIAPRPPSCCPRGTDRGATSGGSPPFLYHTRLDGDPAVD